MLAQGNFVVQIGEKRITASLKPGPPLMQDIKVASNIVVLDSHVNMEGVYYASLAKDSNPSEPLLICLINFSFRETNRAEMMTFKPRGAPRSFEEHGVFGDVTLSVSNLLRKFKDFVAEGMDVKVDLKGQLDKDIAQAKYIYQQSTTNLFISFPNQERMSVQLSAGTQLMQDIRVASNVVTFDTELEEEGVYWGTMPGQEILCLLNLSFRGGRQGEMMTFNTDGAPRKFESFGLCGEIDIVIQGMFRKFRDFAAEAVEKSAGLKSQLNKDVARVKDLHAKKRADAWAKMHSASPVVVNNSAVNNASKPKPMFKSMFGSKVPAVSRFPKKFNASVGAPLVQKQNAFPQWTPSHLAFSNRLSSLEGMLSSTLATLTHVGKQLQDASSAIKNLHAEFGSSGGFQSMDPATPVKPQEATIYGY